MKENRSLTAIAMKRTKVLFAVLLACVTGLIVFICSPSQNLNAFPSSQSESATLAQNMMSPLSVKVIQASEKGALVVSTLIEGKKEAILVDSQLLLSEAKRVAEEISKSGKTLKAIWITHAHPDHYFGLQEVLKKFPNTPVYSTAAVVADIRKTSSRYLNNLKQKYGEDVTSQPTIPQAFSQKYLDLEGQKIEIVELPQGDTKITTALYIPSLKTFIAGDAVYWGVHPFLVEATTPEARSRWMESLKAIKAMNPQQIIPGHKAPTLNLSKSSESLDSLGKYLETFGNVIKSEKTPDAAFAAMSKAYPDYKLAGFFLKMSTQAAYSNAK